MLRTAKLVSLILSQVIPLTFYASSAEAFTRSLGVVRSKQNAQQWEEITVRLQATGVDYCILDLANWQQESDLNNIKILLLPNVENLNGAQALALDKWMNRGGNVIVTGPTGNLSQPEVRSQLRNLFGAYWGFPISTPSTLQPQAQEIAFVNQLSGTFRGGVVIPTSLNSQTAAVWLADGKPPAVVTTDRSTYLGWRWGIDAVASPELDTAWLQAVINRYGYRKLAGVMNPANADSCNNNIANNPIKPSPQPTVPLWQPENINLIDPQESPSNLPKSNNSLDNRSNLPSYPRIEPQAVGIPPAQVTAMNQELQNLIGRYESSFLAAEAYHSNGNTSLTKIVEQGINQPETKRNSELEDYSDTRITNTNNPPPLVLKTAKEKLANFQQLINQQEYTKARAEWLEARRLLWDNYPTDRLFAQPEIRAVWLDRGTIVKAGSEANLAKIFDSLAEAGINTIFFETVNASYTIYPSRIAPEQNPLTRGWDPLQAAVKLAHARGMELHAWVWAFAAANQRHNVLLNQPLEYLGPVLSRHPDWAITDKDGDKFDHSSGYKKAFLDPANPEVQNYLLSLIEEIATRYQVDGIQLDYIRYPFQDPSRNQAFGYSDISRQEFKATNGIDPVDIKPDPSSALWSQWTGYRIRQVDSFVEAVSKRIKEKHPEVILSTAVFPIPKQERLFRLQQNWEEWARNQWVDVIVLMTYALETDNLDAMTQPLLDPSIASSSLLVPGIRLLNLPDRVTVDQVQLLRDLPSSGYALFAAENFTPALESIFNRTQGAVESTKKEPLPYRQPFQSAAIRYQSLEKEWSFLLANNDIVMPPAAMQQWSKDSEILGISLNTLAQNPSGRNFQTAQSNLSRFRKKFPQWMEQQKQNQPYQVQVWENRLETLTKLLNYGETRVLVNKP